MASKGARSRDYDLIVIGSGPAGQRAAVEAARQGMRVAIIEQQEVIGGVCLHTGTIPSKALREAVLTLTGWQPSRLTRAAACAPPTSITIEDLREHVNDAIERGLAVIERQMSLHGVDLRFGSATFTSAHEVAVASSRGRSSLTSDRFLVATGTRARGPAWIPIDGERIIDSDQICSIPRLPERLVILGGGVVAIEYASTLSLLGIEVTVVNRGEGVLPFLDGDLVERLVGLLQARGVSFRLGVEARSVVVDERGAPKVVLDSGETIDGDLVMVALGRVGTADELGLERAGVFPDDTGLLHVNENLQTAAPHIYAAGDVIGQPATASTAQSEGARAARHMAGLSNAPGSAKLLPFGVYTIPEIAYVGRTEASLKGSKIPYRCGTARFTDVAKAEIIGDDTGLLKLLFHDDTRRLLGVHILGTAATDLVQLGHAVMTLGGTIDYFTDEVFAYPTLTEAYKIAASLAR